MIFYIIVPALAAGCLAFLICACIPPLRKFALGSALWFAACAPCMLAIFFTFILVDFGWSKLKEASKVGLDFGAGIHLEQSFYGYFCLAMLVCITSAGATAITLVHGWIIRRIPFVLFRLYLAAVSFGVGVLCCLFLSEIVESNFPNLSSNILLFWGICFALTPLLACLLAFACYRGAVRFRGKYPDQLQIIAPEAYNPQS